MPTPTVKERAAYKSAIAIAGQKEQEVEGPAASALVGDSMMLATDHAANFGGRQQPGSYKKGGAAAGIELAEMKNEGGGSSFQLSVRDRLETISHKQTLEGPSSSVPSGPGSLRSDVALELADDSGAFAAAPADSPPPAVAARAKPAPAAQKWRPKDFEDVDAMQAAHRQTAGEDRAAKKAQFRQNLGDAKMGEDFLMDDIVSDMVGEEEQPDHDLIQSGVVTDAGGAPIMNKDADVKIHLEEQVSAGIDDDDDEALLAGIDTPE